MKQLLLFFISFIAFFSFSQQNDSTLIDSTFYKNGQIRTIIHFAIIEGNKYQHGLYREFDSTGVLIIEGNYYARLDELPFLEFPTVNYPETSISPYTKSENNAIRTGLWKFYYPNGNIRMQGEYATIINENDLTILNAENYVNTKPLPEISTQFFEYDLWILYNKSGEITDKKWFHEGQLIHHEIMYNPETEGELRGDWTWAYRGRISTKTEEIRVFLFLRTSGNYDFRIIYKTEEHCGTANFDITASGFWIYQKEILMLFPNSNDTTKNPYKMITQAGLIELSSANQKIVSTYKPPVFFKCEELKLNRKVYFSFVDPCINEIWKELGYIVY